MADSKDDEKGSSDPDTSSPNGNGDKKGNPFNIQMTEIKHDPRLVKVDQFYPNLEHTFNKKPEVKAITDGKEGEGDISDESKALVKTTDEGEASEKDDDQSGINDEKKEGDEKKKNDVNNSAGDELPETSSDVDFKMARAYWTNKSASLQKESVFPTAVDEETIEAAKSRQPQKTGKSSLFKPEEWTEEKKNTVNVSDILGERADALFQKAMVKKEDQDYAGAITLLNKAITFKGNNPEYFTERAELYVFVCDFQSAILNYKKSCLIDPDNEEYYERLAFLYFFQGQVLFDQRLFAEALESFSRAAEMKPEAIGYHIRSIACLAALNRHGECLALVNKRLETDKMSPDLYILRARLHELFRNTTLCYYDIKDALELDAEHSEASKMMQKLEDRAEELRKHAVQLNIQGKFREGLQKISIAIETNPSVADFHVLRGALHRKLADYNAAIDDFLLALDKCDHNEECSAYISSQRQLLLTYNDFAIECFTKGFYEEAIILLNKAIKGEKREKGLYINRGDCFFRQGELTFSLQDYHQALELDPRDDSVRSRISIIHNEFGVSLYQDKNYMDAESKFTLAIQYNPRVGQYYISRARSRYLLECLQSARQDLIMGLLLDPNNEDIISIMSRLFPGKSVGDVLNSKLAAEAQKSLTNLVPTASPVMLQPINVPVKSENEESDEIRQAAAVVLEMKNKPRPIGGMPDLTTLREDRKFNSQIAEQRRYVNGKVKDRLNERKTLKNTGPKVKYTLPEPAATPENKTKKGSTNWKKFSLGMSQ